MPPIPWLALDRIVASLKSDPLITCVFVHGSLASGRSDVASDLDVGVGVQGPACAGLDAVRSALHCAAPFDFVYEVVPGSNLFLHVEGSAPTASIDVSIWPDSGKITFFDSFSAVTIIVDRFQRCPGPLLADTRALMTRIRAELHPTFLHARLFKHLDRGDILEATRAFRIYLLAPLVQLLRLNVGAELSSRPYFGLERVLPPSEVHRLHRLNSITTTDELRIAIDDTVRELDSLLRLPQYRRP